MAADQPTRDPRDWKFMGSTDGETWVILDERTGQSFADRYGQKVFTFQNTVAYPYYKLEVTANNGSTNRTHLAELSVGAAEIKVDDGDFTPLILPGSIQGAQPQQSPQLASNLFDGDDATKALFEITPTPENPVWVSFQLREAKAANLYTVTSAISGSGEFNRDPKAWLFQGSEDGENWITLDEQSDQDLSQREGFTAGETRYTLLQYSGLYPLPPADHPEQRGGQQPHPAFRNFDL